MKKIDKVLLRLQYYRMRARKTFAYLKWAVQKFRCPCCRRPCSSLRFPDAGAMCNECYYNRELN